MAELLLTLLIVIAMLLLLSAFWQWNIPTNLSMFVHFNRDAEGCWWPRGTAPSFASEGDRYAWSCVELAGPRRVCGIQSLLHTHAIRTRRRLWRAAPPVIRHAQLRVKLTISPTGDGICGPHLHQDLCFRWPLGSGALLPCRLLRWDRPEQGCSWWAISHPSSSTSLRWSDLAGSSHLAHLLLITKIGSSKLPFVDSSRCTACLVSDMFEYKLLSFFLPKAAGQY
jgi:hypothetical protein